MNESKPDSPEAWRQAREHAKNQHKAKVERLRQKVADGLLDPYQDPETIATIDKANLDQASISQHSDDNPWKPLPRSADHDPDSPAHHLPRKPYGKPVNKVVGTQGELEGGKKPVVLSRTGRVSELKGPQPYERGRVGQDSPKDQQRANQQRRAIRQDMRERGEDV